MCFQYTRVVSDNIMWVETYKQLDIGDPLQPPEMAAVLQKTVMHLFPLIENFSILIQVNLFPVFQITNCQYWFT